MTCATAERFAQIVANYERMHSSDREAQWREAASYVSRYTIPVDEPSVEALVAEIRA
jgi:hypothetical protein